MASLLVKMFSVNSTIGVFWFNSADTWVDINKSSEKPTADGIDTYFISETGLFDVFLMAGPSFSDVTRQYTTLTGAAPLPPVSTEKQY
jgi:alpha 1,3-glucosidase